MKRTIMTGVALVSLLTACKKPVPPPLYLALPVGRRDITVSALASGAVEAITVVSVKSRASGTILRMPAETGRKVHRGDTLVLVDKRDPTNAYNQAQSDLSVARANLQNATANKQRIDAMFANQLASEQDHETANLQFNTAQSQLVRAQISLQQASDALSDCNVLAPVDGTVLTKGVDVGTVIASAVNQVSGGTTLLTMANLDTVQLRVQVDETDIGKIQPDQAADITVDAYPNFPFQGSVLKIEPQSTTNNNVTMFPVLIRIPNTDPSHQLLPGMNAEVEIHVAQQRGVLAVPNAALRTPRDVGSAAMVLGLSPDQVQRTLAAADSQRQSQLATGHGDSAGSMAGRTPPEGGRTGGRPDSRTGGDSAKGDFRGRGAFRGQGGMGGMGGMGGGFSGGQGGFPGMAGGQQRPGVRQSRAFFSGSYIVFVLQHGQPTPRRIRVGVTDMDFSEVTGGLTDRDTVLLLPSASLVQSQQDMKDRFSRMTSGSGVGAMKQQPGGAGGAGAGAQKGGR